MDRLTGILFCVVLFGLLAAGCSPTDTGLAVGWDYQDLDGDHIRNGIDTDVDGDGVLNTHDVWPLNGNAW
jgi:hypothetical protein